MIYQELKIKLHLVATGIIGVVIASLFLLGFKYNIHCDQYTSFAIATFNMEPHVEEGINDQMPLIYKHPYGISLRIYLSSILIGFLFWPSFLTLLVAYKKLTADTWKRLITILSYLLIPGLIMPENIIGERFKSLYFAAVLVGSIIYLLNILEVAYWIKSVGKHIETTR